jgi:hypothetical protein
VSITNQNLVESWCVYLPFRKRETIEDINADIDKILGKKTKRPSNSSSVSLRSDREARQSPIPSNALNKGRGSKLRTKGSRKYPHPVSKEPDADAEDVLTDVNSVPPDDSVLSEPSEGSEDEIADNLLGAESD